MDDRRFDNLARTVAGGGWSRRAALRSAAGGALGALLTGLGLEEAAAACVKPGQRGCQGRQNKTCCPGATCQGGNKNNVGRCVCKGSLTKCGGACVNTQTNSNYCGGCNNVCVSGTSCQGGRCVERCAPDCDGVACGGDGCGGSCGTCGQGQNCQGGQCLDECGGCPGDQVCRDGACACPNDRVACGAECVDFQTNPDHCGACGVACAGGERCQAGECVATCTECVDGCVDTQTDPNNCGACDNICAIDASCQQGRCIVTCKAVRRACKAASDCCQDGGPMRCGSNLHNPPSACSSSFGTKCCRPRGGACAGDCDCCGDFNCTDGFCACPDNWRPCKGACIPNSACCTTGDCGLGAYCRSDGICVCPAGTRTCNGGCIPSGDCCGGADCGAGYLCRSGACVCQDGTKECNGACIPTGNCCTDGDCIGDPPCPPGYINCDNHCHEDGTCRLCPRGQRWECNTYKPTCDDELRTHCTCLEPDQYMCGPRTCRTNQRCRRDMDFCVADYSCVS